MFPPEREELDEASAEFFTDFDKGEQGEEDIVAHLAGTASDGDFQRYPKNARVGKGDAPKILVNADAAPSIEICMNQGVRQTFADGLVDGGVINAVHLLVQGKGGLDVGGQTGGYPRVEVIEIPAPVGGQRRDAVAVSRVVVEMLDIIHKIVWEFADDAAEIAEHQERGQRRADNAVLIASGGSSGEQKLLWSDVAPWGSGPAQLEAGQISPKCVLVQVGDRKFFGELAVSAFAASVSEHGIHGLLAATVVSFAIAAIGACVWVGADEDWTEVAVWPRDIHHDNGFAAAINRINATVEEDVGTDLLAIVDVVP